jgi:hypothetical protein
VGQGRQEEENVLAGAPGMASRQQRHFGGMDFRKMFLFNQAMLGHQGWRLLSELNSLLKFSEFSKISYVGAN